MLCYMSHMSKKQHTKTAALLNITQAARLAGKHRSTIQRAIKSGLLSKTSDVNGQPQINIAELERVYGPLQSDSSDGDACNTNADKKRQDAAPRIMPQNSNELNLLQLRLEVSEKDLERAEVEREREREQLEQRLEELRKERDEWKDEAKKSMLLLTHQKGQEQGQEPQKMSFLGRLFGRT